MVRTRIDLSVRDQMALARSVRGDGGFQGLLRDLQLAWNQSGRGAVMHIESDAVAEKIRRYAADYGDGGWQGRLQGWVRQLPPAPAQHVQGGLL